MAQPVFQHAFHAGEWSPNLYARVDLAKYRAGAALLENFFVDYRGGASSRPGTQYVLQAYKPATPVRLIPFVASSTVQYILEFGDHYIRFFFQGGPILEAPLAITGATNANPAVLTITNTYSVGDWIYVTNVGGMTQLNGQYFQVLARTGTTVTLGNILTGTNIDSTTYGTYTSGGSSGRVYTLATPYAANDLALLKFVQTVNKMVLCHGSYPVADLTLITANNWVLANVVFGPTINPPSAGLTIVSNSPGSSNVNYIVTSVDGSGQESIPSAVQATSINPGSGVTVTISWTAVVGAVSYNVYRTTITATSAAIPSNVAFGFIGNCQGTSFIDTWYSNASPVIGADFSQSAPQFDNPFGGGPVNSLNLTTGGVYTSADSFPVVTIGPPPAGGTQMTATAVLTDSNLVIVTTGFGYIVGEQVALFGGSAIIMIQVDSTLGVGGGNGISTYHIVSHATLTSGPIPSSFADPASGATFTVTSWAVKSLPVTNAGSGYTSPPTVTVSGANPATATSTVISGNSGAPSVPAFYQERLVLAAPYQGPQEFFMSRPGSPYDFDISFPSQDDDAITGSIVSSTLNSIKSMIPMPTGLIILSDRQAWLVNGGGNQAPVTPTTIQANSQAYNGASDVPPIVANYDILYVQNKSAAVRDLTFNFYTQIFTGTDISVLSSHLFYGFTIKEWSWAEEPYKTVWAVRNDGVMLSLAFMKEQEVVGWSHHDTQGLFKSTASVVEPVTLSNGTVAPLDAVYFVVQRTINGTITQYIERMAERFFNGQAKNAWCVDAALKYSGAPLTTFSGLTHLVGMTVTGLADGAVISPQTVSAAGTITLATAASLVTIGLAYTCNLQTLRLDTGDPTIQGKRKKIPAVTVRVQDTLGLSIGGDFTTLVPMKDLVVNNVGSMSNHVVMDLVTDDARTLVDPRWTVQGQYCIQQALPLPATILGVIPEIDVGDTPK